MSPTTLTFGCRLNAAESVAMQERAAEAGLEDAILVNTCAVTAEAVRQARQAIRKARREHPGKRIVVSGCAAQTEPQTFAAMPEVDLVLGNEEKLTAEAYRPVSRARHAETGQNAVLAGSDAARLGRNAGAALAIQPHEKISVGDIFSLRRTATHLLDGFSPPGRGGGWTQPRAFVQVQNGCDHRCTFCIIPYGRGNSRSVPIGAVVAEVRRLAGLDVAEVVLTGVDITAYGADLPGAPTLGTLVRAVLKHVPELPRLRLSSIDSVESDPALMRAIAEEERLMPHLHLSLQAGDDMILKRMKRRHSRADAIRFAQDMRRLRPDVSLGADLIAGFPTETEDMFRNTLSLVEACGLTFLHVFPFSPRPGTPAARMPQVDRKLVQERARRLREVGDRALAARLAAENGRRRKVLIERPGIGRTEHYLSVTMDKGQTGAIVSARIAAFDRNRLIGLALSEAA